MREIPNVYVDLSGSGVDGGMLEACVAAAGPQRLLWGADLTLDTGWAKLRYLEHVLDAADLERVKWSNAARIFPPVGISDRLMRIDVNAFLGAYPYRRVPGTSASSLLKAMDRTGIDEAWVRSPPELFWRNPWNGNEGCTRRRDPNGASVLFRRVHPAWRVGREYWATHPIGRPAVRCDPTFYGLEGVGGAGGSGDAYSGCGVQRRTPVPRDGVRLEDGRQRHPNDRAAELPAAAVRALLRSDDDVRLLITQLIGRRRRGAFRLDAGRAREGLVGHHLDLGSAGGSLETLLGTIGVGRLYSDGQPLRLPERAREARSSRSESPAARRIESGNVTQGDHMTAQQPTALPPR